MLGWRAQYPKSETCSNKSCCIHRRFSICSHDSLCIFSSVTIYMSNTSVYFKYICVLIFFLFTCQIHQSISSTFVFSFLILVIKLFIILNIRFYPNSVYTCLTNLKATSFQKKIFLLIQIKQHNLTGKKITFCLGFTIILQINGWQFI